MVWNSTCKLVRQGAPFRSLTHLFRSSQALAWGNSCDGAATLEIMRQVRYWWSGFHFDQEETRPAVDIVAFRKSDLSPNRYALISFLDAMVWPIALRCGIDCHVDQKRVDSKHQAAHVAAIFVYVRWKDYTIHLQYRPQSPTAAESKLMTSTVCGKLRIVHVFEQLW